MKNIPSILFAYFVLNFLVVYFYPRADESSEFLLLLYEHI